MSVAVRVLLRQDDGHERAVEASVQLSADSPGAPKAVELRRSIAGSLDQCPDDQLLEEVCRAVESWLQTSGTSAVDHRTAFADALGMGRAETPPSLSSPPQMLGTPPLLYPGKGSLPGKKGARTDPEVPPVPPPDTLSATSRTAQAALQTLVEAAGGRLGLPPVPPIPVGHTDVLADTFEEWAEHYGTRRNDGIAFSRPGLWHALDRLLPLQDPNRWNNLRKEVILELQRRGWERSGGPKGASWWIPKD